MLKPCQIHTKGMLICQSLQEELVLELMIERPAVFSLYRESPLLPPQISVLLPAHPYEHRPSVAVVEPDKRELPQ
jgi:hypothetical protein